MPAGQLTPSDTHGYGGVALTPDDDNDLANVSRDTYIGTGGALKITGADGIVCVFGNVGVGKLGIGIERLWSTGTTASNIVALY